MIEDMAHCMNSLEQQTYDYDIMDVIFYNWCKKKHNSITEEDCKGCKMFEYFDWEKKCY